MVPGYSFYSFFIACSLNIVIGPVIHSLDVSEVSQCVHAAQKDRETFGIACTRNLIHKQEVFVEHSTDIARLKSDARNTQDEFTTALVVIHNATILTMDTGDEATDLIERGVMVIEDGVITAIGEEMEVQIPAGAVTIDALGGSSL